MSISILQAVLCITVLLFARLVYRRFTDKHSYPPGPLGIPFLGNVWDVPKDKASSVYQQWSEVYDSDVIRMKVLGTNILVLNSLESANDLLDKRSANYSDRPHLTMISELVELGWVLPLVSYGDLWRDMRKAIHHSFNADTVKRYRDIELQAARELAQRLAARPSDFMEHMRHLAGRLLMRAVYGLDVQSDNDRYVGVMKVALNALQAGSKPGTFLVDTIPILKYVPEWFPGAYFQRQAKVWRSLTYHLQDTFFNGFAQRRVEEDVAECGIATAFEHAKDPEEDQAYSESVIKTGLGSMIGGGSSTHISALNTFVLTMVLHPDVQKKAQAELDAVVGSARLPEFSDRDSLPYLNAMFNEQLRWRPVVTLALPHVTREDDFYRGWFIPKGSVVIPNVRAMLHDEHVWENPSQFDPERFLVNGQLNASKVRELEGTAFGFGRRVCPGRYMARDSMWIAIATILATMDIRPAIDASGKPIIPAGEYDEGLVAYPKPFLADIRPRSSEHLALVQASSDGL